MNDLIQAEARAGFPRLAGARLSGTLRVKEGVVNAWLRRMRQVPPGLTIGIQAGNTVVVRYSVFQATAVLDEAVEIGEGGPRVRLVLASGVLAWALRPLLSSRAVSMHGRKVTIDLAALDPTGAAVRYAPMLRHARLRTTTGQMHVEFDAGL